MDTTPLADYLSDLKRHPLLTREEEQRYARAARAGDEQAKETLVNSNLRFVVNISRQYQNRGIPLSDLISEGNIGLLKAVEKFDPERGFHFTTYAVWWIRQSIMQTLTDQTRTVRVPVTRQNMMRDISRATHHLGGDHRDVTVGEIAERLGVAEAEVLETMLKGKPEASLDRTFEEGDDRNLLSTIPDESNGLPDDSVSEQDSRAQIEGVLATLDDRERYIVRCYYGLDGEEPLTLERIGGSMGLTRERVRQLKERALSRLRDPERYQFLAQIAD
jgi:RNA polymerase primary sigma factor